MNQYMIDITDVGLSSVDGVGHAAALGKEPYGSGSSDVCLPIPDGKYVTKFV